MNLTDSELLCWLSRRVKTQLDDASLVLAKWKSSAQHSAQITHVFDAAAFIKGLKIHELNTPEVIRADGDTVLAQVYLYSYWEVAEALKRLYGMPEEESAEESYCVWQLNTNLLPLGKLELFIDPCMVAYTFLRLTNAPEPILVNKG